jgi:hypothetical protein
MEVPSARVRSLWLRNLESRCVVTQLLKPLYVVMHLHVVNIKYIKIIL